MRPFNNLLIITLSIALIVTLFFLFKKSHNSSNCVSNISFEHFLDTIVKIDSMMLNEHELNLVIDSKLGGLNILNLNSDAKEKLKKILRDDSFMLVDGEKKDGVTLKWEDEAKKMLARNLQFQKHAFRIKLKKGIWSKKFPMIGFRIKMNSLKQLILVDPAQPEKGLRDDISGVYIMPAVSYEFRDDISSGYKPRTLIMGALDKNSMLITAGERPFIDFFDPCPIACDYLSSSTEKEIVREANTEFPDFIEYTPYPSAGLGNDE